jgi:hypothetical protein
MTDKSGIICLVNAVPKDREAFQDTQKWRGAIFYYEGTDLENFRKGLNLKDPECDWKSKTGFVTWEGNVHGTSLCNTICRSLLAVLSCRY